MKKKVSLSIRVMITSSADVSATLRHAMGKVADYIIELLDEMLGGWVEREKRYPWALGDQSEKTGRRARLPFDAVWEARGLVVEVDEDPHRRPVTFWDKPDRVTVSGVDRREQRRVYDRRKRAAARSRGYAVIEIEWECRPPPDRRDPSVDRVRLEGVLRDAGIDPN
jgi:hypothetical protein